MPEPSYQHDIFLSYAREDRERIKLLAQTLESLGWSVWWDRWMPTGKSFDEVIQENLDVSRKVLVVWSKMSIQSNWVREEAREGARREVLFPVLIDQVAIPLGFRRMQAADLIHWQGDLQDEQWQRLVEDLASVLGPPQQKEAKIANTEPLSQNTLQTPEGMVCVPKGPFLYADDRLKENITYDFLMDRHSVTKAAFAHFIKGEGYGKESYWSREGWEWRQEKQVTQPEYWDDQKWNQTDSPVVGVSYHEAEAYANWAGKRLPTEQEWEKAARGTDGREYPWGEEFDPGRCACSVKGKRERTTPIGTFSEGQSPYGCQGMAGNVWEWCVSWYGKKKGFRVLRGVSWSGGSPGDLRCAGRFNSGPRIRHFNIGFRCAQDAP